MYDDLKRKYDYLLYNNPELKHFDDLGVGTSPSSKFENVLFESLFFAHNSILDSLNHAFDAFRL